MLKRLVKIANKLDSLGLTKEADVLDRYITKVALDFPEPDLEGLPDSPEELARMRADKAAPMVQNVTYGPGATSTRGVGPAKPEEKSTFSPTRTMSSQVTITKSDAKAREEDQRTREELRNAPGSGYLKPQVLVDSYAFSFTPTLGRSGNIAKIQQALTNCGFNAGTADGYWGKNTDMAFKDALYSFLLLSPEEAAFSKLTEVVAEILNGNKPTMPFTYEMVIDMCKKINDARARGEYIPHGIPMAQYIGSKGGGRFVQRSAPPSEADLVSTKAGEPVAGTPRKV